MSAGFAFSILTLIEIENCLTKWYLFFLGMTSFLFYFGLLLKLKE